ncbi:MAG: hypothetical protein RBS22_13705 [Spongiibacteraceae bacterium]|jgi:hypothetical protein|nr:hypothetical protein [Spongiibacteraceae bacterium]
MTEVVALTEDRITIIVDANDCAPLTVELAVELAASVKGSLQALFIENTDLLSTSRLPFSCEITLTTGQQRALNPELVETGYRRQAARFRQLLEQKARQAVIHYSFESVRSRYQDLMSQTSTAGYLIMERRRHHPGGWQDARNRLRKRILVLDGENQRLLKALHFLCNKFPLHQMDILWLEDGGRVPAGADLPHQVAIQSLPLSRLEAVLHSALDYVLVTRALEPGLMNYLISESHCPVILVT